MSCGHGGWHDCGPWSGPRRGEGWYGPEYWYDDFDRPVRHRYQGSARSDATSTADDLEARLSALRDAVHRAESELAELRGHVEGPS
jgi:hypothetical protein